MPGIIGFISTRPPAITQLPDIQPALKTTMLHEPEYRHGTLEFRQLGVTAGWVSHQRSFSDCLPIWNEKRDICLLFSGENFLDTKDIAALEARGHSFGQNDGSYLVHLYEEKHATFVNQLNGLFCGLLIDFAQRKVFLFNDRYGLGRIYYHEAAEGFYFASEAKALLAMVPRLRRLDTQGLGEFFACGCVLENRTLFSDIHLVPNASFWTFEYGRAVSKDTYFDPKSWEQQPALSEAEFYEKLKTTFAAVVPRYFSGRQKVAMSLTGGLDSRLVMAWLNGCGRELNTYSNRGMFNECADARIARRVAGACGLSHQVITVDKHFLSEFPKLAAQTVYITDGAMSVSAAAGLYANRLASRQIAPVRVTGNYGGEILRGIVALHPAKLRHSYFDKEFAHTVKQGVETVRSLTRGPRLSVIAFKQVPWHHYARFALESSQWTIRSPYLDNELVPLAYQAPKDTRANQRLAAMLIKDGNSKLAGFPTDRGPLGRTGLFGRLAESYQEFTFKADCAYDYGMPHSMVNLDRFLAPLHLERIFLGRHKYFHFRFWYRYALAPFVRDTLLSPRALSRWYLDRRKVEQMVNDHVCGLGNYTSEIHVLLTLELMQRQLIES